MSSETSTWTAPDGASLRVRRWSADNPRAVLVLVHGLGEHTGRYEHVGEHFNRAQLSMTGFDMLGHGLSPGRRGDLDLAQFDEQLHAFIGAEAARAPEQPIVLYGHSLGGLLVLWHALRREPPVKALVVSGPPLRTALTRQRTKIALVKAFGRVLPHITLSAGLQPSTLSRDDDVVETLASDELSHNRASLGFARGALKAMSWTLGHAANLETPTLVLHGADDQLNEISGSEALVAAAPNATLIRYEGLRHEVHNEPERTEVLDDAVSWIGDQLQRG